MKGETKIAHALDQLREPHILRTTGYRRPFFLTVQFLDTFFARRFHDCVHSHLDMACISIILFPGVGTAGQLSLSSLMHFSRHVTRRLWRRLSSLLCRKRHLLLTGHNGLSAWPYDNIGRPLQKPALLLHIRRYIGFQAGDKVSHSLGMSIFSDSTFGLAAGRVTHDGQVLMEVPQKKRYPGPSS